jgi:hypothetical protein
LDSEEEKNCKVKTYAQTISFTPARLNANLFDWPTFKIGLQVLIRVYGPDTDWPTRYLAATYNFQDKAAAQEALQIIRGNYSTEIITEPRALRKSPNGQKITTEGRRRDSDGQSLLAREIN